MRAELYFTVRGLNFGTILVEKSHQCYRCETPVVFSLAKLLQYDLIGYQLFRLQGMDSPPLRWASRLSSVGDLGIAIA